MYFELSNLKWQIQKPAFPWEFYIYRQLDRRILDREVCCCQLFYRPTFSVNIWLFWLLLYQRSSYGFAHGIHLYSDCSILICNYIANGTLQVRYLFPVIFLIFFNILWYKSSTENTMQDVINSYVVLGKAMEEVLCIYYTIEMLHMVETLHGVGLIHGDFKPDNLLIRYAR